MKNIVDRIENLFAKKSNFDESGFVRSELVTPKLAYDLGHLSDSDRKAMKKLGYEFKWFNADMTDGIVFRWVTEGPKRSFYILKLYFNETYPKEVQKGAETNG